MDYDLPEVPERAWDDILMEKLVFYISRNWTMQEAINHLDGRYSAMEIMTRWSIAHGIVQTRKGLKNYFKGAKHDRRNTFRS